ncbi:MAG: DUF4194 domain-containing protein [Thermacetogeniaceae bacterium]|jgi:hypothetical protein|nr:DUF4194 domain-containing protein [Thermoanaerobacterales bacterium]NLN21827.1 DUF4194 domain-containing protein [Syntrophomonadaceae bacterium]HAF17682.1 hypothetical protein [Peptococcaceae bacterium]
MWFDEYEQLTHTEKEQFILTANQLLSKTFIIRDKYSPKEKRLKLNPDYRFIERHLELFRRYLRLSGWELEKDNNYGVIALYNRFELNRAHLNKRTTIILYILRLIYEEKREKLTLKREITTNVGEVVGKMINLGLIDKKPPNKDLIDAFRTLRRHQIIDYLGSDVTQPDTGIIIYPSILFVVTNEKITEIYELAQAPQKEDEDNEDELTEEELEEEE